MASRNLIEIIIGIKNLASGDLDKFQRKLEQSAASWRRIGFASSAAGVSGLTTMSLMGKSALNNADNVDKMSKQVGQSAEEFQRLSYAAKMADASESSVALAITRTTIASVKAAQGNKTYQAAFKNLGIEYLDSAGKARKGMDIVMDMADAFHRGELSAETLAAGLALISIRGGRELIPFLKEGRAQLEQWMATAPGVISNEDIEKLHSYGKVWESIGLQLKGATATFVTDLLPTLTKVSDGVKGLIDKFEALPGSTKASIGQFALLGSAGLTAAGGVMILAASMVSFGIVAGPLAAAVAWANSFTIAIAGMQVPLIGVVAGFLALWSALASIGNILVLSSARKELNALQKEADTLVATAAKRGGKGKRGFFTSGEEARNTQIIARQGQLQDITTRGGPFLGPMGTMKLISQQVINAMSPAAAAAYLPPMPSFSQAAAAGPGPFYNPTPITPSGFTPSIFGGAAAMPLPALRTVRQTGQNINLNISVDTTSQAVQAVDDFLADSGID